MSIREKKKRTKLEMKFMKKMQRVVEFNCDNRYRCKKFSLHLNLDEDDMELNSSL